MGHKEMEDGAWRGRCKEDGWEEDEREEGKEGKEETRVTNVTRLKTSLER